MAQNPVLINSFFSGDSDNLFLAGGTIAFYDNTVRTQLKDIYSDYDLTIPLSNPLTLDALGSTQPIYLPDNQNYYVVIRDSLSNIVREIEGFRSFSPNDLNIAVSSANNLITNPEFKENYSFKTNDKGYIDTETTHISSGWIYYTDETTDSKTTITFVSNAPTQQHIRSITAIDINCSVADNNTTRKDLTSYNISGVNEYDGARLSYKLDARSLSSNISDIIEVYLLKNYGSNGSENLYIKIGEHTLTSEYTIYSNSFDVPIETNKMYGDGNSLDFIIRMPLSSTFNIQLTSVFVAQGDIPINDFYNDSSSIEQAKILAKEFDSIQISDENATDYIAIGSNKFNYGLINLRNTGEISFYTKDRPLPYNVRKCDGSELLVNDYSENGIPYSRLYTVIGGTYGQNGDLSCIIDSKNADTLILTSEEGRAKTAPNAGTMGNAITITEVKKGYNYGCTATYKTIPNPNQPTTIWQGITFEYTEAIDAQKDNYQHAYFTPVYKDLLSIYKFSPFDPMNVNTGSSTVKPKNDIVFTRFQTITALKTTNIGPNTNLPSLAWNDSTVTPAPWAAQYDIAPAKYALSFTVDGTVGFINDYCSQKIVFDLSTKLSLEDNIKKLIKFINKGYTTTIKLNSYPEVGKYFEISSETVDYYVWYDDGTGTDPAVTNRTGIKVTIPTASLGTLDDAVKATNTALNTFSFKLPTEADIVTLPASTKVILGITL